MLIPPMRRLIAIAAGSVALLTSGGVALGVLGGTATSGSGAAAASSGGAPSAGVARAVVAYADRQLGVPYLWGGTGPGGFDCSGLTQAAYAAAGVAIPRTSEQQWLTLPHLTSTNQLRPGDLVFFNAGEFAPGLPGHVGIYIGNGQMIDAPHTGAVVRKDALSMFASYVGAARPANRALAS
jgi:cell wall-associated NlpC family hydrolase